MECDDSCDALRRCLRIEAVKILILLSILLAPLICAAGNATSPLPFRDGDRWCVLGDSITRSGHYHRYVELFYLTRFPDRRLDVINCGISGDTAPGALKRLKWDSLDARPTVVSVMLGMNDVMPGLYNPEESSPDIEIRRAKAAERYYGAMRQLTVALKGAGVQVILITPSIFDDTADLPRRNYPGCGAALAAYGSFVRSLAAELDLPVIDFNGTMTAINAARQRDNPRFTIVGGDRIHPTAPGHLVMAHEFLRAQGLAGPVSRIAIDAAAGMPGLLENCAIERVRILGDGIAFSCIERALPFPVETAARPALALVPFARDFGQQILVVGGLSAGDYALSIDGKRIREFDAAELAAGVDLALEPATPQALQAAAVLAVLHKKWETAGRLRNLAYCEHYAWPDAPRPVDLSQMPARLDERLARIGGANPSVAESHRQYLRDKPREAELRRELDEAMGAARLAAQPQSREFRLVRVRPATDGQEN